MEQALYFAPIIIIFLLTAILVLALKRNRPTFSQEERIEINSKLNQLYSLSKSENPSDLRDMVIRIDTLFGKVMQKLLRNKNSCGDNLKLLRERFTKIEYEELWKYHKLRNSAVHEDIQIISKEAVEAYKVFKHAILKLIS